MGTKLFVLAAHNGYQNILIQEHQTKTRNKLVHYIMLKGTVIVTWERKNNMHRKLSLDENDALVRTCPSFHLLHHLTVVRRVLESLWAAVE